MQDLVITRSLGLFALLFRLVYLYDQNICMNTTAEDDVSLAQLQSGLPFSLLLSISIALVG